MSGISVDMGVDADYFISFLARPPYDPCNVYVGVQSAADENIRIEAGRYSNGGACIRGGLTGDVINPAAGIPASTDHPWAQMFYVVWIHSSAAGGDKVYLKAYRIATDRLHPGQTCLSGQGTGLGQWTVISGDFYSDAVMNTLRISADHYYCRLDEIRVGTTWVEVTGTRTDVVPYLAIEAPTPTLTQTGPVDFLVTCTSYLPITIDLTPEKVTLLPSEGTVNGAVEVLNGATPNPTIRVKDLTGFGKLRVAILPGAAFNSVGSAPSVGPSQAASVYPPLPNPPTSPTSESLSLWWDASNVDGSYNSTITDGANFTIWTDLSGKGNNGTARGVGAILRKSVADLNGKATAEFDGTTNDTYVFATPITSLRTVFWVLKVNLTDGFRPLMGAATWGTTYEWHAGGYGIPFYPAYANAVLQGGEMRVLGQTINTTATPLKPYGNTILSLVTTGDAVADNFANDRDLAAYQFGGNLSELLIYNRALSDTEVNQTGRYLANKYGKVAAFGYPEAPSVTLTYPAAAITVPPNSPVVLKAMAAAAAGATITSVDFYADWVKAGTATSPNEMGEWSVAWTTPATTGTFAMCAVAKDDHSPTPLTAASPLSYITVVTLMFVSPTGTGTGTSWADAASLATAVSTGGGILYLKGGTYNVAATLYRTTGAFSMYGGFAGTETLPEQRSTGNPFTENVTLLDGGGTHQILCTEAEANLDRITFANGNSGGNGGGLLATAHITMLNCAFRDCVAGEAGGGAYIYSGTGVTVQSCKFVNNTARTYGGGLSMQGNAQNEPVFAGCEFTSNTATTGHGGGLFATPDYPTVQDCRFVGNKAPAGWGGGMYYGHDGSNHQGLIRNVFIRNSALRGGAMAQNGMYLERISNNAFLYNTATDEGGGAYLPRSCILYFANCTFVGNRTTNGEVDGVYVGNRYGDGYTVNNYVSQCLFVDHTKLAVSVNGFDGSKFALFWNLFADGSLEGPNGWKTYQASNPPVLTNTLTATGNNFVDVAKYNVDLIPSAPANGASLCSFRVNNNSVAAYHLYDWRNRTRPNAVLNAPGWTIGCALVASDILSPVRSGQILAGDTLRLAAADVLGGCRWDFGDGRESTLLAPGLVTFPTPGEQTIGLYVTDEQGGNDALVATRTLTVVPDPGTVPDLAVLALDIPPGLEINESSAAILYTVRNNGDAALTTTSWTDAIYLSRDPYLDVDDTLLTSATVTRDLGVGESYQGTLVLTVPAVAGAPWYLILSADDEWAVLERHQLNNERAALLNISIPELEDGVGRTVAFPQGPIADYHKIEVPSGQNLLLRLDASLAGLRVYVRFGALPTEGLYDYMWDGSDLLIPAAAAGSWYILVYDDSAPQSGEYTIRFETVELKLLSVSPPSLGEAEPMELTLTGVGFAKPIQVELAAAGGATYSADTVEVDSFTRITASFAAGSVPAGVYTVRVSQSGGGSDELPGAFEVVAGGEAHLETNLILPATVGYHTPATLYVEYRNTGTVAMLAPLLTLTASQNGREAAILTLDKTRLSQGFWTSAMPEGYANSVQFVASGENHGVLQPGESHRMAVYYAGWQLPWNFSYPPIQWNLGALTPNDTNPVDWAGLKAGMRPSYVREDAWDAVWANLTSQAGSTWGDYMAMLDRNAVYLNRLGQRVEDIRYLLAFSFRQADALSPVPYLASDDDALVQAPGLPIAFHRAFAQPISRRYELGPLGRGWAHNWQISLESEADGTIAITDMTGTPRIFQPDRRYAGKYLAQPGDQGALTAVGGGGWSLREADGLVLAFRADRKFDYVEDTNGNRITCGYSGDHLTDLTHSSGQSLHLAYNAAGRIASVTDDDTRQTLYTYSADGEHLVSIAAYDGRITAYAYSLGQGAAKEHALTEIAFPGGTHRYFTYDAQRRLASTSRDNGAEAVAFSYDSMGTVAATDALNNTSRFSFDHWGRVAKSEDALGRAVLMAFDDLGNLTALTDPAGHTQTYAYDSRCNLIRSADPLRHITQFAHSRTFNRLASVTDAKASRTTYAYDTGGNPAAITYADGNRETWTYDVPGNPAAWTNRRGHAIGYTFNSDGRVTRKTYPAGSHVDYTYDARGRLTQAVDAYGTTAFTYDSDDYLTRMDYPGGRRLEFTYDAAGRRASSLDQLGHRLDYHYDAAGRLDLMTNESSAQVVQYEYDGGGRLSRKTVGNGVYATYEYDAAGQLLQLVNRKPDDTVLSRFAYTYDSRGRRTSMDTHYGLWTYGYDDTGQLVRAELDSTDPEIPDQDLTYVYDALGNRIYTLVNGIREDYVTNNMNQYVEVGGRTYTFDADGNLTQEAGPGGTTVYTYNDENRLVGVARGADTWLYTYDALGNRVGTSENGAVTHCVIDPIGLGNVIGEYNAAGGLIARYDHGFGLLDRVDGGGNPAYYTFDAIGSAQELTVAAGAIANAYGYEPYGASLKNTRVVPNPFEFVGEYGVMKDSDALSSMRAREFTPGIGRFISSDPFGLVGDDVNLYRYAGNNPLSLSDPTGLTCRIKWKSENLVPLVTVPAKHVLSQNGKEDRIGGVPSGDSPLFWCCRRQVSVDLKYCYYSQKPVTPPPAPSGGDASTSQTTGTTGPVDPNGKLGPSGFGAESFVTGEKTFAYRVDFENDPAASAPAQIVNVADALSPNLDWAAFELTEIGFGDQLVTVPSGLKRFETAVPFTYNDVDFEVRIEAGIHADSGKAYVNFYSIDPGTELPPAASVGFLPPEDGTGRGTGHVSYIVRPKAALATGAAIRNVATIQFNFGETIATNQVDAHDPSQGTDPNKEALVTIDAGVPESHVLALPAVTKTSAFQVSWTGEDDTGGSGIAGYDVFVRDNGGPWTLWLNAATPQTSAVFTGADSHTYGFYSVAADNVGHRESAPAQADATTRVEVKNAGSFAAEWWKSYR